MYDENWERTAEGVVKDSRGVPPKNFKGVQDRTKYKEHSEIEIVAD